MRIGDLPDEKGHFGPYGGVFVAETLMAALDELKDAYFRYSADPAFVAELEYDLKYYVGRPSPVYHAKRWSEHFGGAQLYLTGIEYDKVWELPPTERILTRLEI